jgi:mRNA-degrading endonuclease RelE of RelBE toxin-antitoxin system
MENRILLTQSAKADIAYFQVREQRIIASNIYTYLSVDADVPSRKKKQLRPNPIAQWELRIDKFRVFFSIEKGNIVKVVAVGYKEHKELFIRGNKVEL